MYILLLSVDTNTYWPDGTSSILGYKRDLKKGIFFHAGWKGDGRDLKGGQHYWSFKTAASWEATENFGWQTKRRKTCAIDKSTALFSIWSTLQCWSSWRSWWSRQQACCLQGKPPSHDPSSTISDYCCLREKVVNYRQVEKKILDQVRISLSIARTIYRLQNPGFIAAKITLNSPPSSSPSQHLPSKNIWKYLKKKEKEYRRNILKYPMPSQHFLLYLKIPSSLPKERISDFKFYTVNCRSLTKVKFSTDQVRPALGSGSWWVDC